MAKVVLPLISIEARGQFAKSMVYFPWKGIQSVRKYIIPANPKTAAQEAIRTKFKAAITKFHALAWTVADITAWRTLASVQAQAMTHFNVFVKNHVLQAIAGKTWKNFYNGVTATPEAGQISITVTNPENDAQPKAYIGTTKTYFHTSANMIWSAGPTTWSYTFTGLPSGVWHYLTIILSEAAIYSRVGVYSKKST